MFCPNKSSYEWQQMVAKVGEDQAYKNWLKGIYELEGSDTGNIGYEEFQEQRRRIGKTFNSTIEFDPTLDRSASVKPGKGINVIVVNPNKLFKDTLVHEYGHIMIDALGGMDNPMIRAGYNQIKDTQQAKDIREKYSERSEVVIQKEILNGFLTANAAKIQEALNSDSLVRKFTTWLDLFWNRIKSTFGMEKDIAKDLAGQMLMGDFDTDALVQEIYDMKVEDTTFTSLKGFLEKKLVSISTLINHFNEIMDEDNDKQKKVKQELVDMEKDLRKLLTEYHDTKAEKAVVDFLDLAEGRFKSVEKRLKSLATPDKDGFLDLNPKELKLIKQYVLPYKDMRGLLKTIKNTPVFKDSIDKYEERANNLSNRFESVNDDVLDLERKYIVSYIANSPNNPTYQDYVEEYQTEFEREIGSTNFFGKKTINGRSVSGEEYRNAMNRYVSKKIEQNQSVIRQKELQRVEQAVIKLDRDISMSDFVYETGFINEDLIQEATNLIQKTQVQIDRQTTEVANEYGEMHKKFVDKVKSGKMSMEKLYDKLIDDELDMNGNKTGKKIPYMSTEYNASFSMHLEKMANDARDIEQKIEGLQDGKEREEAIKELDALNAKRSKFISDNTIKTGEQITIKDKWRNDIKRNEIEQEAYDFLVSHREKTQERYNKENINLTSKLFNAQVMRLPKVSKTMYERMFDSENPMDIAKNWYKEKFEVQSEDVGYAEAAERLTDEENRIVDTVPIYFRGNSIDQSYDLFSIHLLDEHSAIRYKEHNKIASTLELFKDVSENRVVGETKSVLWNMATKLKNKFSDNPNANDAVKEGSDSGAHKILESLIKATIYGNKNWEKGNNAKIARSLIQMTSATIMAFNYFSSIPNLAVGQLNALYESLDTSAFSMEAFGRAHKAYYSQLNDIIGDVGNIRPNARINILSEHFNPAGNFRAQYPEFSKDSQLKQTADTSIIFSTSGMVEHYTHSSIMLAVLEDVKILDKDGKFINEKGKSTDKFEEAMSLNDYIIIKDNKMAFDKENFPSAVKTTHSQTKIGDPLIEELSLFTRDIATSTQGLYASDWWVHANQFWFYEAFNALRGWFVPGVEKRLRGISSLRSENDQDRVLYSRRRGQKRSGSYTDTIRFMDKVKGSIAKLKFDILREEWDDITPRERNNIRKSTLELASYGATLASVAIMKGLMDEEKEPPPGTIFLLYSIRRIQSEIGFYGNPQEFWRIMRSPAPLLSMVEDVRQLVEQAASDIINVEFERYERGEFKGQPKLKKDLYDVLPVFRQVDRKAQKALDWLENPAVR